MKGRKRTDGEERLVGDLLARLGRYRVESVICVRCRRWGAHDQVAAEGWYHFAGDLYCPQCAAEEFSSDRS
jgi:hypothetical protein